MLRKVGLSLVTTAALFAGTTVPAMAATIQTHHRAVPTHHASHAATQYHSVTAKKPATITHAPAHKHVSTNKNTHVTNTPSKQRHLNNTASKKQETKTTTKHGTTKTQTSKTKK